MNAPATQQTNTILFPPGRIVQGDLYEPNTKDMKGNPLTTKSGQNAGQSRVEYFFKLAIPKTQALWWNESWGAQILAIANAAWPQGQTASPKFAWKIEDGDSAEPNFDRGSRKNCETEGFAGCWVIKFSSGFATKVFDEQGTPLVQPGLVKRGYWVEVMGTVNSNEDPNKSGIFINHNMVAYRAPGKEIVSGPDPRAVGFGRAALPAGVTAAPVGSAAFPGSSATPPAPGATPSAPTPSAPIPSANVPTAAPTPAATPPTAVAPHTSFIAPPMGGAQPAIPTPPAAIACPLGAPAGYRMANVAGGRYEAFLRNNWTDASMLAAGHMVKL